MIVVFPFENLGPAADEYFAAGIADEITSRLSALKDLGVLSRTSALRYERTGRTMPQIAEDLGVDYVLDGTVRWARDASGKSAVRVTPQLVRAREDRQVWSSSYDRTMDQIFTIQSEIAGEVVDRLGVAIGGKEREALEAAPTSDVEAYHAYLRAHAIVASTVFAREAWERAAAELEEACSRDPKFLRAFSDLAQVHAGFVHFAWDRSDERLARSKRAVDRALELDPASPWAQLALGYYHYWGRKDYEPAYQAFTKAKAGLPSSVEAINGMAFVRRRQGRFQEAAELIERSAALDPRNALTHYTRGETLTVLRRYDEGRRSFERAIALDPNSTAQSAGLGRTALLAGDAAAACASVRSIVETAANTESRQAGFWTAVGCRDWDLASKIAELLPEVGSAQFQFECRAAARGWIRKFQGDQAGARAEFERAKRELVAYGRDRAPESNHHSMLALVLAELGEKEAALEAARRALTLRPASNDAWLLMYRKLDLAVVEIVVGEHDAAIKHLRELIEQPSDQASPALLRQSPLFDPLRGDPKFERLAADPARP
jgi:TolB-like protein/tetratricopeptide (TPR) repeat protein